MTRNRTRVAVAVGLLSAGSWLGGARVASATMEMQKKGKELGVAQNCQSCHTDKLPKKGAAALNAKGQWLLDQKKVKKAAAIDVAWLKEYVEKK